MSLDQAFHRTVHPAYICETPVIQAGPLIFESPHHSIFFPPDFQLACEPVHVLRQSDRHVDSIFQGAKNVGFPFLGTRIARSYIDFNRATNSVHPDHTAGELTRLIPAEGDFYAAAGLGLVRTRAYFGRDIRVTDEMPTEDEILRRISEYWEPYHNKLADLISGNMTAYGTSCHVTCHSFPMQYMKEKDELGDHTFFIGTSDGKTASDDVKRRVIDILEDQGFKVADNYVLKGVELVKRHGKPEQNQHSVQIEIVREAYMDNDTCEPHEGIERVSAAMTHLARELNDFMKDRPQTQPASEPEEPDQDPASECQGPLAAQ